ncbi:anti-sigma factor [Streptomyces sp. I6]|uniref:anti-sigma factor n=1 Tax=Streptomyces sp. I6 TaxID=2483113 RepID=UPI0028809112|nr:anti-sigma factor [Streptomyces sp. I6]
MPGRGGGVLRHRRPPRRSGEYPCPAWHEGIGPARHRLRAPDAPTHVRDGPARHIDPFRDAQERHPPRRREPRRRKPGCHRDPRRCRGLAAPAEHRVTTTGAAGRPATRRPDLGHVRPDARTVQGRTTIGATTAVVTSRQLGKAVFVGTDLPRPAPGKTYQLWYEDQGTMHPAGLLERDGAVAIEGNLGTATAIGLTIEPDGGSPRPTSTPLMLLTLPA